MNYWWIRSHAHIEELALDKKQDSSIKAECISA